jgi:hypothetical protein
MLNADGAISAGRKYMAPKKAKKAKKTTKKLKLKKGEKREGAFRHRVGSV